MIISDYKIISEENEPQRSNLLKIIVLVNVGTGIEIQKGLQKSLCS